MRPVRLAIGIILILYTAAKVYLAFHNPNIGPELMADATLATLATIGAIACFAAAVKTGKQKSE